jgi:ribonuclease Z
MKLTLLGTGTPIPDPKRAGASQTIESGGELVLIDCGAGAMHRLAESGYVQPGGRELALPIRCIALTHLHSDHITGLADLLWAGWVMNWWTKAPLLIGPPGTAEMVRHLVEAFRYDITVRTYADALEGPGPAPDVEEIEEGYETEGSDWRLSAFRVDHSPVDQAFGFRIDAPDSSIAISGDTCYCENLVRHSEGVDLLVHEVYWRQGMQARIAAATTPARRLRAETIARYHTPAEDTGRIAREAGVRKLVLSHLILGGGTNGDLLQDIAPHYHGPVAVGADLQTFELSNTR